MKFSKSQTLTALAAAATLSFGTSVSAATLVLEPGNIVAGVSGIDVGGTFYDMTWTQGTFEDVGQSPPALTNATDAQFVAQTVVDLFNTNSITRPQIKGLTCQFGDCDIVVAYQVNANNFDAFNVDWETTDWVLQPQTWLLDFQNPIVAQAILTEVAPPSSVPLPAGGLLIGTAMAGLFAVRRRKN